MNNKNVYIRRCCQNCKYSNKTPLEGSHVYYFGECDKRIDIKELLADGITTCPKWKYENEDEND
jgi:hypothetical protein